MNRPINIITQFPLVRLWLPSWVLNKKWRLILIFDRNHDNCNDCNSLKIETPISFHNITSFYFYIHKFGINQSKK